MGRVASEIEAAGARIVWILEQDYTTAPGTADTCDESMDELSVPSVGLCVGDGETMPTPGAFDESAFSVSRGFDMIVSTRTMEILWASSHGSPSGNDNLDGDAVLSVVREVVAAERSAQRVRR